MYSKWFGYKNIFKDHIFLIVKTITLIDKDLTLRPYIFKIKDHIGHD